MGEEERERLTWILLLQAFLMYSAAFLSNVGNYKSFGDIKFIPDIPQVNSFFLKVPRSVVKFPDDLVH